MRQLLTVLCLCFLFSGCKKETETVVYTNNTIPDYSGIPTLMVENYVNRLYIDLIGREPTDSEMSADVAALEAGSLSTQARISVIDKLMSSTTSVPGDGSYAQAYHQKFYDDNKARYLDGASEDFVAEQYAIYYGISVTDSATGDVLGFELIRAEANKIKAVMDSRDQLRLGQINVREMSRRMCFNLMYDDLHMNAFNYINATFNDNFFRYPTEDEMDQCLEPVESNVSGVLFGNAITNKSEYLGVLLDSGEFTEGMIRWAYQSLLAREANTNEVYSLLDDFNNGQDIKAVQKSILITDEYAGFQ